MPEISARGTSMPPSPIRKLVPYADAAKKRGLNVYHLNIGQPDVKTPPAFLHAVKQFDKDVLEYSHSGGIPSFRAKMAQYYQKNGMGVSEKELIITTGASEAIRFAFLSCLNPGDEIIVPEPFYANYNGFGIDAGIVIKPITTQIAENFDLPEIEDFEKLIGPKTRAIMICNPGNPTGKLYDLPALNKLKQLVQKHDLYLFADEVYREFCYDGETHFSTLNLKGIEQNVVVFDSLSKRFSACGARIGTLVTRNKNVIDTAMKFAQARLSPPTFGQIGGEAVMDLPESYYKEVVNEYRSRRDVLVEELNKIPGVVVPQVSGAFYMIVKLPVKSAENFCQWMLESFEFDGATVMMAPAAGFYATPGLGQDEVRIAYVLNSDALKSAMKCLGEGLKVYNLKEVVRG